MTDLELQWFDEQKQFEADEAARRTIKLDQIREVEILDDSSDK